MAGFSLNGIVTALVTPFSSSGEVDEESLREVVRFQLKNKVHGFFALGTTGMGPAMQTDQRKRIAELIVAETDRHVPVIVQVGASDPVASLELATHAEKIGASAIASLTPFYYHPGETAMVDYFSKLAKATALPIFIYNIPSNTGNNVNVNLLLKLSKIRNVVGIKDSSGDFSQLVGYLRAAPEGFSVMNGTDLYLFSALCAGVKGGVSASANVFPELFVGLYETYRKRELDEGAALQMKVHAIRTVTSEPPIAPLLEALRLRGLRSGLVKEPLRSMTPAETQNLRDSLSRILPDLNFRLVH